MSQIVYTQQTQTDKTPLDDFMENFPVVFKLSVNKCLMADTLRHRLFAEQFQDVIQRANGIIIKDPLNAPPLEIFTASYSTYFTLCRILGVESKFKW